MGLKGIGANEGADAKLHLDYERSPHVWIDAKRFIECLPVPSGLLSGSLLKLLPWQVQVLKGIWPPNSPPRKEVLICISRRNGKSVFLSALLAYLLYTDHPVVKPDQGSVLASCANTRMQSKIIFDIIRYWRANVRELFLDSTVKNQDGEIIRKSIHGVKYKLLTSKAESSLGQNFSVCLADELGEWRSHRLINNVRYGMRSNRTSLVIQISTVPEFEDHWWYSEIAYFMKVKQTPTHYSFIRVTKPSKQKPWKEETWKYANPSYGHFGLTKKSFQDSWEAAKLFPTQRRSFLKYACNAVTNLNISDVSRFLTREAWEACTVPMDEEGYIKPLVIEPSTDVVISWDASSTSDLTCLCMMTVQAPHQIKSWFWVPQQTGLRKKQPVDYQAWEQRGWCTIVRSPAIPKTVILDKYEKLVDEYNVVSSQSDAYSIGEIRQQAAERDISLDIHAGASTKYHEYHIGLQKMAELVRTKQLINDNPIMTFCMDNLKTKTTPANITIPDRRASQQHAGAKVDGAVCLLLNCLQLTTIKHRTSGSDIIESLKNMYVEV